MAPYRNIRLNDEIGCARKCVQRSNFSGSGRENENARKDPQDFRRGIWNAENNREDLDIERLFPQRSPLRRNSRCRKVWPTSYSA